MRLQGFQPLQAPAGTAAPADARRGPVVAVDAAAAPAGGVSYDGQASRRAAEIMSGRDLHNISRNELQSMANEL